MCDDGGEFYWERMYKNLKHKKMLSNKQETGGEEKKMRMTKRYS